MSEIVVSAGQIEHYAGGQTTLKLRIFATETFTPSTGEAVVASRITSEEFYAEVDCTASGDVISYDTFTLDSTTDALANPGDTSYVFVLFTDDGTKIAELGGLYSCLKVPATPTPTTLGAIVLYSNANPVILPDTYYTAAQVNALLAALVNMANKATEVIYGAVRLSEPAASAADPEVLGTNDKVWTGINETVYLHDYGENQAALTAALSAIGADPTELRLTNQCAITSNATIPENIIVSFEGSGAFTVASGTLTINSMRPAGNKQVFFTSGLGAVVLGRNAAPGGEMNLCWWTGQLVTSTTYNTFVAANVNIATDVISITSHGYTTGDAVVFTSGAAAIFGTSAVNTSTDTITVNNHGFFNGDSLFYSAAGGAIGGLTIFTFYYVVNKTTNTFQLAATVGGSPINFTSTGSSGMELSPLIAGLSDGLTYYVIVLTSGTFKLAISYANALAGTAINLTSTGGSTNTLAHAAPGTSGDLTAVFDQLETSLTNNDGGTLKIGPGIWRTNTFDIPSYSTIVGTKNGLSGASGTILQLADLAAATYIAKIGGNKRNIEVRDICFDTSTSTTSSGFLIEGAYPNTTSGIKLVNCTFGGGGTGAPACCWIKDPALTWQCVNVELDHCVFQVPTNGIGFRSDTVNTSLVMIQPYFGINAGGIGVDFLGTGATEIINPLFEGNAGYFTATAALNRTITSASITIGTKIITINSGGAWNLNDIGQKIVIGAETFNIAGIANDGLIAYTEFNAAATHTALSTAVYRYTQSASMAYACFRFRGDRSVVKITSSQDEAMAYFIVKSDSQVVPITIEDSLIQSIIQLSGDTVLNLRGNRLYSQQINTTGAASVTVNSFGDRCLNSGAYIYDSPPTTGVFLLEPTLTGVINTTTIALNQLGFNKDQLFQEIQAPTRFSHVANWSTVNPDLDHAVVEVGSAHANVGTGSKADIRWGRLNGFTNKMDYWYQTLRDYDSGACWFQGSQTGFKNYRFDAALGYIPALGVGGTVTQGSGSGKATAVTLNKVTGQITMNNATLAGGAPVTFDLGNTEIDAGDYLFVNHISGGTAGAYYPTAQTVADGAHISVRNLTGGGLSEAIVLQFELRRTPTT